MREQKLRVARHRLANGVKEQLFFVGKVCDGKNQGWSTPPAKRLDVYAAADLRFIIQSEIGAGKHRSSLHPLCPAPPFTGLMPAQLCTVIMCTIRATVDYLEMEHSGEACAVTA